MPEPFSSMPIETLNNGDAVVGISVAGVEIDPRSTRALTSADVVTANQGTSPWVTSTTISNDTNFGLVGANTLRVAAEPGNASGPADFGNGATSGQTPRMAANLAVAGADVSASNPVPVQLANAPIGTSINNYNTVASVANNVASNHDYAITAGKTFYGKKIWATCTVPMKIEVQISPDGSAFSTLWVGFNTANEPNISIDLDELVFIESGTGAKIRVIRTVRSGGPAPVFSTISGQEV